MNNPSGDEVLTGSIPDWREYKHLNVKASTDRAVVIPLINNGNGEEKLVSATASTNVSSFELSKIMSQ